MFDSLLALKKGSPYQRRAYEAIQKLGVLDELASYDPIVCGTIPLNVHDGDSDLDIIFYVHDLDDFARRLSEAYQSFKSFSLKTIEVKGSAVVKANFYAYGFEFELFGMNQLTTRQNAYLHMMVEAHILMDHPEFMEDVRHLKREGFTTEAAFCECLGLDYQNPFERLKDYGEEHNYI
ncbi:DUF4269 domain-containing protein [Alkalibacillus almallahensis]|uniref:DUF4269 domain-containing protein n=1 Tax=Alkalibacillus almallahensis TaxID=1379154 RepID=UPI001423CA9B|nr:hypothetical protein [Alkalibacillus almallahensis]